MRRTVLPAAILLATALLLINEASLADVEADIPPAAAAILSQMDKEISVVKTRAIANLDKVLKDTTKKGDLAGALAIKQAIDRLKDETQVAQAGTQHANRTIIASMAGRWMEGTCAVDLSPDGTVKADSGMIGRWSSDGKTVEVRWNNGHSYVLTAGPSGLIGVNLDPSGKEHGPARLVRPK